jgi:hypothetical protein
MLLRSLKAAEPPGRNPFQPDSDDHCDGQAYGQLPVVIDGPAVMVAPFGAVKVVESVGTDVGKPLGGPLEKSLVKLEKPPKSLLPSGPN